MRCFMLHIDPRKKFLTEMADLVDTIETLKTEIKQEMQSLRVDPLKRDKNVATKKEKLIKTKKKFVEIYNAFVSTHNFEFKKNQEGRIKDIKKPNSTNWKINRIVEWAKNENWAPGDADIDSGAFYDLINPQHLEIQGSAKPSPRTPSSPRFKAWSSGMAHQEIKKTKEKKDMLSKEATDLNTAWLALFPLVSDIKNQVIKQHKVTTPHLQNFQQALVSFYEKNVHNLGSLPRKEREIWEASLRLGQTIIHWEQLPEWHKTTIFIYCTDKDDWHAFKKTFVERYGFPKYLPHEKSDKAKSKREHDADKKMSAFGALLIATNSAKTPRPGSPKTPASQEEPASPSLAPEASTPKEPSTPPVKLKIVTTTTPSTTPEPITPQSPSGVKENVQDQPSSPEAPFEDEPLTPSLGKVLKGPGNASFTLFSSPDLASSEREESDKEDEDDNDNIYVV